MAKFTNIGVGFITKSKKGTEYVSIRLDESAMKVILPEDLKKICMFKKESKSGKTYYQITAPMKDDYEAPKYDPSAKNVNSVARTESQEDDSIPF